MYRFFSCVVGRGCLLWPVPFLGKMLLNLCPASFFTPRPTCLFLQVSLDFLLLHSSPLWWKGHHFLVLVLEGLVGLHRTLLLQHLQLRRRLGLLWHWMVCLGNKQRSCCRFWDFEPKHCISDSCFLWGYSISSKGFLITVIWIKYAHSRPFQFTDS